MHEMSVAQGVVNTAVKHADGRIVEVVHVRLGHLRQVIPDSLAFYFGFVSQGTLCEGAELTQEVIPARLACGPCDREWGIDMPHFRCPECGGADVTVVSGNELEVESIEVKEVDQCIAPR